MENYDPFKRMNQLVWRIVSAAAGAQLGLCLWLAWWQDAPGPW